MAASSAFRGRPRGRRVVSRPSAATVRLTHIGPPSGQPRATLVRTRSNSASACLPFTSANQCAAPGRVTGQSASVGRSPAPKDPVPDSCRRPKLLQGHVAARPAGTSPARSGLAST